MSVVRCPLSVVRCPLSVARLELSDLLNVLFVRLVAFSWLVFVVVLSVAKSSGYWGAAWGGIESFLGGNRQMHFAMACILSLLGHLAFHAGRSVFKLLNPVLIFLSVGCVVDESLQYFLPARHFNPYDALVSLAGLVVGFCLYRFVRWL